MNFPTSAIIAGVSDTDYKNEAIPNQGCFYPAANLPEIEFAGTPIEGFI
jgi:hypothetical protein